MANRQQQACDTKMYLGANHALGTTEGVVSVRVENGEPAAGELQV